MAGKEVFNGVPLAPQVIEKIKRMTDDCPNLYFGTVEYPNPPVACGMLGCRVLEEGCKRLPGAQKLPEDIQRAISFVTRERLLPFERKAAKSLNQHRP